MEPIPITMDLSPESKKSSSSTGSNSSSTGEEERLKRLFNSCDVDGDGYLDSNDFVFMCKQLNMEDSAQEIMNQLGLASQSRITFEDFIRCKSQVVAEEVDNGLFIDDQGIESDNSGLIRPQTIVTSWPTMSSDSFGVYSGQPDSLDYDSGARDMSPEPTSLQQLMETHDPEALKNVSLDNMTTDFLELANRLHLAALTSLKGEIIEVKNRLQHVTNERDVLEKQLNRAQADKVRLQRDFEDRLEQTTARYEERVTELHSVIAELRKKIERHQINVIREEDEFEESDVAAHSTKSNDGGSQNANDSQANSLDILGNDLNCQIPGGVTKLEGAPNSDTKVVKTVDEACNTEGDILDDGYDNDVDILGLDEDDSIEEHAIEACKQMDALEFESASPPTLPPRGLRPATFHPPPPPPPNEFPEPAYLQEEINSLRQETAVLQEQIQRQEAELNLHKAAIQSVREERDRFKRKVQEMQGVLQQFDPQASSPQHSRTSTPTKSPHIPCDRSQQSGEPFPVAKVAELKKLKTCSSERPVLGSEISSAGLPNTKVAEHLVQSLQECSNTQEIVQSLYTGGSDLKDEKVKEFEIEFERLQSKIDNLKSQNDLLNLTLEESKAQSDRLSVLIGKYESNNTALQLAVNYSDQAIEAYDVLTALIESELGLVLANCRAVGISAGYRNTPQSQEEITQWSQRTKNSRKIAENIAKHLLQKLDRTYASTSCNPWDEVSSTSHTASTTSSGYSSEDFTKMEEQRLREFVHQLKSDRAAVKLTVMELESVHLDPDFQEPCKNVDAQRMDLENAVLMQELMAMKEEKAELKAHNYLIGKEKQSLELRLSGKESQEQAYIVQIEHLKSELEDQERQLCKETEDALETSGEMAAASYMMPENRSHDSSDIAADLVSSLKREKKLKSRVHELVVALEKLSRNSEIRHQQSAEFVNDLKKANSALIAAFDKAKKKYQNKLKKLELQIQAITDRYESQLRLLKQRLVTLETESGVERPLNETSL